MPMPRNARMISTRHHCLKSGSSLFLLLLLILLPCATSPLWAAPKLPHEGTRDESPRSVWTDADDEDRDSLEHLQRLVMDFSDEYMASLGEVMDAYVLKEGNSTKRVAAQYWKVRYTSAAMSIASARDPRMNLLDMVVFISAGKWAVNNYWIPKVFGANAEPLARVYREMDVKIWAIAAEMLTDKQQTDLRQLLINWEHSNPRFHEVSIMRLRHLDGVRLSSFDDGHRARGILGALRGLLKRVNKSLLYGERLMFTLNHTPEILAQQSDLTIAQVGQAFPLAAVRPETIADAIKEFPTALQAGLDSNAGGLKTILPQLGATLESVNSLAATVNASVQTLGSNSKTIDPGLVLQQANQALSHLDASISGMNQLVSNNSLGGVQLLNVSGQIDARVNSMLDAALRRILLILGAIFAGVVILLLVIKALFFRKPRT